ncbi:MAG: TetR/AcrR family transcriptional regulator [Mycobacterium sp.]|nr:TetR/AcrR family transcriptional regulator [Mycobacterium sp.]
MGKRDDTRQRMLTSALSLLRERGPNAVTLDSVLAHSGAPRGSIYHHFPGGRDQLVIEAAALGADAVAGIVEDNNQSPFAALDGLVDFWKKMLQDSDFRAGCPIVALAVDGPDRIPDAAQLSQSSFQRMATTLIRLLREAGASQAQARPMANVAIAALEGAVILCRVERSTRPLDDVADMLRSQLAMLSIPDSAVRPYDVADVD